MFTAVRRGQTEEVQALIDAGADVDARNSAAHTPLHVAVWEGNADVAQVRIDARAAGTEWRLSLIVSAPCGLSAQHLVSRFPKPPCVFAIPPPNQSRPAFCPLRCRWLRH